MAADAFAQTLDQNRDIAGHIKSELRNEVLFFAKSSGDSIGESRD